jgi:hypothetical protein
MRGDVMKMLWRGRYRGSTVPTANAWLVLFWQKWEHLIEEMGKYRDRLSSLTEGDADRNGMTSALFELLVCIFLTPEQIQKLKAIVDASMHTAMDDISAAYAENPQGNRRWIIHELTGLEMPLMTETYMVHVDITSPNEDGTSPLSNSTDWWRRRICPGPSEALRRFVRAEITEVEEKVRSNEATGRAWQAFLRTVQDASGTPLQECTLCDGRIRDVIYLPCGHLVACSVCAAEWAARVNTCPYCRREVTSTDSVRRYLTGSQKKLPGVIQHGGKDVKLTLNARLAGGDVLSLLTQLRDVHI